MTIFIVIGILFIIYIIVKIIASENEKKDKQKYEAGEMTDEEKKQYEERLARKKAQLMARTIQKVQIIGNNSDSRKKASSSITRGLVGGALLGPVGMVGGAMSGKNKITNTTTFLIQYADGHKITKTVKNDSIEFKNLIRYIEM